MSADPRIGAPPRHRELIRRDREGGPTEQMETR
jgi:hypothetical protein